MNQEKIFEEKLSYLIDKFTDLEELVKEIHLDLKAHFVELKEATDRSTSESELDDIDVELHCLIHINTTTFIKAVNENSHFLLNLKNQRALIQSKRETLLLRKTLEEREAEIEHIRREREAELETELKSIQLEQETKKEVDLEPQ